MWIIGSILAATCLLTCISSQENGNLSLSACFTQPQKTIYANCSAGYMVKINDIFFGYSPTGVCGFTPGDCTLADAELIPCVGHPSCGINLPSGSLGRRIPKCDEHSTYLQAYYECIPEDSAFDICEYRNLNGQRGYIKTPRYPNNYPANQLCTTTITVDPSQHIKLYIIDLDLESGTQSGCVDWLYIQGEMQANSLCGQRGQEKAFTTVHGNTLSLTFESDSHGEQKGFWLYYEAYPPLPSTTTVTTQSTAAQTPPFSTTGIPSPDESVLATTTPDDKPKATSIMTQNGSKRLPVEAIIGGVLGTLLFILLILLILLIIKRRKEREMGSSQSTSYLTSKPVGSPMQGTPGPYIQNNLHPYHSDKVYPDKLDLEKV